MVKTVSLWIRPGTRPKVVRPESTLGNRVLSGALPGELVRVIARNRTEAERLYALNLQAKKLGLDGIKERAKSDPKTAADLLSAFDAVVED